MYKPELIIDGISSETLDIKIFIDSFNDFSIAETKSSIVESEYRPYPLFKAKRGWHARKTALRMTLIDLTQDKIDNFKSWILKENVYFSISTIPNKEFLAYKIEITNSTKAKSNFYILEILFTYEPFAQSKNSKTYRSKQNFIEVKNDGTAPATPLFEFTATSNIKMFGLTHPDGKTLQIGYENSPVIIFTGQKVVIDTFNCSIKINNYQKYFNPASKNFEFAPRTTTKIGITTDSAAEMPTVFCIFKEKWL